MSGVLNRFKGESDFQLVTDARKLRGELTNWLNNPKHLPKRYRWYYMPKIGELLDTMVDELKDAQRDFPYDQETLEKRREHIEKAMESNFEIWKKLQSIYDTRMALGGMNLTSLEPHLDSLYLMYIQMKAWKRAGIPKKK